MRATAGLQTLGITGPIGCGKTTVGDILLSLGALARIDADTVTHSLMGPGSSLTREIGETFGARAIAHHGGVDRRALAVLVFNDPDKLAQLEALVHPRVGVAVRALLADFDRDGAEGVVVVDAIKLLQSDMVEYMDGLWLVRCSEDEQRRRLRELRGMTPDEVEARLSAQPSFDPARFDEIIDNDGSRDDLVARVTEAWLRRFAPCMSDEV